VLFDRFLGILGAGWEKSTTMSNVRANDQLIKAQEMEHHPFHLFLDRYIPEVEHKSKQLNQATWILETTGLADAADLRGDLDAELRFLFQDPKIYQELLKWDQDLSLSDPILKRELNVLIREFKGNQLPKELIQEIAKKEAILTSSYGNFRAQMEGKFYSENELREILAHEKDLTLRKRAWEASKQVGEELAPQILELVKLRNRGAKSLGYSDYFEMQLDLQEVDRYWLSTIFEELSQRSKSAYAKEIKEIESVLFHRFGDVMPWSWSDPFCQEDPLAASLDQLVSGVDLVAACTSYYKKGGFDVEPILQKSDLYERAGKSQHAFCTNIDRRDDVRTLNNIKPSIRWLETLLHELGHAVYELGFDGDLPWLLRTPPHMIPTEAMALLAGRQAYRSSSLHELTGKRDSEGEKSLRRRQLIFSRWVLVMTAFERELYRDPSQDLNRLWWKLGEEIQMIHPPKGREGKSDWAAKMHIGLAPVYYFSYLLGEFFASSLQKKIINFSTPEAGKFLQEQLFAPGNRWSWDQLVCHVTGKPLSTDAWVQEFA
jgi:peptidyl-dipeptidase A